MRLAADFMPGIPGRQDSGVGQSWLEPLFGADIRAIAILLVAILQVPSASAQTTVATDPTTGFDRLFGLGGRACKQYDDTGRLYLYSEGLPAIGIISWLQQSDGGTKANVPMPQELIAALPHIPGCMPGKHHAAPIKD